jgi:PST family polysaccharide transporter
VYVGLILGAMGADFYPRLASVAKDNAACNSMVNEQTQVGLLLAGPGIIATVTYAPFALMLFYSSKFGAAAELLRWICIGMSLRVLIWPMSTIMAAKGAATILFLADLAWTLAYVGLAWALVNRVGLNGAGIAFFGSYVFQSFVVYFIARWISGFRWSARNWRTGLIFLFSVAVVFSSSYFLPSLLAYGIGTLVVILFGIYSIREILGMMDQDRGPRFVRKVLSIFSRRVAAAEKARKYDNDPRRHS